MSRKRIPTLNGLFSKNSKHVVPEIDFGEERALGSSICKPLLQIPLQIGPLIVFGCGGTVIEGGSQRLSSLHDILHASNSVDNVFQRMLPEQYGMIVSINEVSVAVGIESRDVIFPEC